MKNIFHWWISEKPNHWFNQSKFDWFRFRVWFQNLEIQVSAYSKLFYWKTRNCSWNLLKSNWIFWNSILILRNCNWINWIKLESFSEISSNAYFRISSPIQFIPKKFIFQILLCNKESKKYLQIYFVFNFISKKKLCIKLYVNVGS